MLPLLCLVVASCVGPLTKEQTSHIHSVGVISLLGDRISLSHVRLFDNKNDKVIVVESQFDMIAENTVIECAKAVDPTLQFTKITIPKQPLMDKLYSGLAALYNATMSEIRVELLEWVKQNPVDAIVIVREVNRQVPARGPSQYFAGLGLHQFLGARPLVQVSLGIVVWDARTLEQMTAADFAQGGGEYPESIEKVGDQLGAGQRIPLVPILQRLLQTGLCGSVKKVNL
jgi:hypothetical protein